MRSIGNLGVSPGRAGGLKLELAALAVGAVLLARDLWRTKRDLRRARFG